MAEGIRENTENDLPFKWSAAKEKAALLVALDELTNNKIAEEADVTNKTLWQWKQKPEFQSRVDEHQKAIFERIRRHGLGTADNRVKHMQRRHELLNQITAERSASPEMEDVPGGKTGLLVHNVKSVGAGMSAERVDLYEVDAALLKEQRDIERQIAQELGQWTDKRDITSDGKPLKGYAIVSPDDWDEPAAENTGEVSAAPVADPGVEG